jgi:aspartate-semialdehyde dehydrogenase
MAGTLRVGVLGATGMVGQRFLALLEKHPWFKVTTLAASASSAGKTYKDAVAGRWAMKTAIPPAVADMQVLNASAIDEVAKGVDFVFCAVDMPKDDTKKLEEDYARREIPVVPNTPAHRGTADVPMMIPEINASHTAIIADQRKRLGTRRGFIAVKPNCSLQSYVPAIDPLMAFAPKEVFVCTYQAISGAGKTFETWPDMVDNVIPFIKGEEQKSEEEPMKIWGKCESGKIVPATLPRISAQCIRVPASDGHMAAVFVRFAKQPTVEQILDCWKKAEGKPQQLKLPSAPVPYLNYLSEENRPQTKLDRDAGGGMAITIGRLRPDPIYDYKFVCLSHNTVRGAAGGAVLTAELLAAENYITATK